MKVEVDATRCQRTGFCTRVAPNYFSIEGRATAETLKEQVEPGDEDVLVEAEDLCPTRSIRLS